jgi:MarR family transcriptional regulator, organic hydroperoxide resistance regulator
VKPANRLGPAHSTHRHAAGVAAVTATAEAPDGSAGDVRLGKVLGFMRLVWGIDHGLQTTSKRMEASFGVTGLQRLVIRLVGRFPLISAGGIADILRVHPSTLTGVLRRLEQRGAVERRVPPDDQRRALFQLTRQGRQLDELRAGTTEAAVRRALSRHTAEELAHASAVLATLARELGQDEMPAGKGAR